MNIVFICNRISFSIWVHHTSIFLSVCCLGLYCSISSSFEVAVTKGPPCHHNMPSSHSSPSPYSCSCLISPSTPLPHTLSLGLPLSKCSMCPNHSNVLLIAPPVIPPHMHTIYFLPLTSTRLYASRLSKQILLEVSREFCLLVCVSVLPFVYLVSALVTADVWFTKPTEPLVRFLFSYG